MTLIEIIVVITILSLLMAAVGVAALGALSNARHDVAVQDVQTAISALDMFRARKNRYPTSTEGFRALVESRVLKAMPKDTYGSDLTYELKDGEPVVTSLGADMKPGGTGDDADITSP